MQTEIQGDSLVITIPIRKPATASKTGKSRIVATTSGNTVTNLLVEGKPLKIGLNAFIEAE